MRCIVITAILLALGVAAATAGKHRREVECRDDRIDIPPYAEGLYNIGITNTSMNFDALVYLTGAVQSSVDIGEYMNTINGVNPLVQAQYTVAGASEVWNRTWANLAFTVADEGKEYLRDGDNISAASAYHRASVYLQLAGRFTELLSAESKANYKQAVSYFVTAVGLKTPTNVQCQELSIPYDGYHLHGYWCPARAPHASGKRPTIISLTGYDGSAEAQYFSIGAPMSNYGFNVLMFEGPGQAYTARFTGKTFTPNYSKVTSAVLDYASTTFSIDMRHVFCWGESFGGYLSAQSFANEPRFLGLVANTGVYDFYQAFSCNFPKGFRAMYMAGNKDAEINNMMAQGAKYNMGAYFIQQYGLLGFGANTTTAQWDSMEPYNLIGQMAKFDQRPFYAYSPAWDTMVGNQAEIFWSHTGNRSALSEIVSLNPFRGTGMHCAVGSTNNLVISIARWLGRVLKSVQ